jgi:hypothetical protein
MPKHPSITPLTPTGKANFMLYGAPSAGKTSIIAQGSRTLIIRPPTDHTDAAIRAGAKAHEWIVERWPDMDEVEEFARHNPDEYDWIWLDSISLFQDHGLEDIMAAVEAAKPHRRNGPIDQGEYNANFTRLTKWCRHMIGIPGFNFGVTAHPAEIADNLGNVKLRPWVQGKNMSFKICGMMNIVGYLEVVHDKNENDRRVLRLRETDDYEAKDQFELASDYRMVDPTMKKIEAALPGRAAKPAAKTSRPKSRAVIRKRK